MPIIYTGNEFDVAIKGEGFFVVGDINATQVFYTRMGNFRLNNEKYLTSQDGLFVLDMEKKPIVFHDKNVFKKLAIAKFEKPEELVYHSNGYFLAPSDSVFNYGNPDEIIEQSLLQEDVDLAKEFVHLMTKQKEHFNKKLGHLTYVKVTNLPRKIKFVLKLPFFYAKRIFLDFPILTFLEMDHESHFPRENRTTKIKIVFGTFTHIIKTSYSDLYNKTFFERENPLDPAWKIHDMLGDTDNPFKRFGW